MSSSRDEQAEHPAMRIFDDSQETPNVRNEKVCVTFSPPDLHNSQPYVQQQLGDSQWLGSEDPDADPGTQTQVAAISLCLTRPLLPFVKHTGQMVTSTSYVC